jgi:hypothetical protein
MTSSSSNRNSGRINLGRTIWLNSIRVFCTSIVWAIIVFLCGLSSNASFSPLLVPVIFPIVYLSCLTWQGILTKMPFLLGGGNFANLVINLSDLLLGAGFSIGDPLVFLIYQLRPSLIPIREFKLITIKMYISVFN